MVIAPRIENRPCVVGLPYDSYVEYFSLLPDGIQFVIFRPRDNWDYCGPKGFRCFFDGIEVIVNEKTRRYRDGGTTHVCLGRTSHPEECKEFYFPTPFKPEEKSTYDGKEIMVYERI